MSDMPKEFRDIFESMGKAFGHAEQDQKVESTENRNAPFHDRINSIRINLSGRWRIAKLLPRVVGGVFTGRFTLTVRHTGKRGL